MPDDMKAKVSGAAKSVMPWKEGIAWWVVLIQGIILTGLGIYMFFAKSWTLTILAWIIAIALMVSGALSLYASLNTTENGPVKQWTMIHGGIGLAAGAIVALLLFFQVLPTTRAFVMGLGCLAYGGVGVYMLIDKKLASLRRISLIGTIFFTLAGILILLHVFGMETLVTLVQLLKLLVIITGVILIFWALIIRNEATKKADKPSV